jgi:hypothetical protein
MTPLQPQGKGISLTKFVQFSQTVFVIVKYVYIFGWGAYFFAGVFPRGIFYREVSFQGVDLSGEICQNSCTKFFLNVLLSLSRLNFTRGAVKGNCPG